MQELAFTLADGLEYVRAARSRGLDVDAFAPRLSFFFAIGMNFFMEAPSCAPPGCCGPLMAQEFAPKDPKSLMLRTHCQTSGVSLPSRTPTTTWSAPVEALAAVLGGTQSLHTNAFDEALGLPTRFSARIARNTQLILPRRRGWRRSSTRWRSYYVESLTDELVRAARALIEEVEGWAA